KVDTTIPVADNCPEGGTYQCYGDVPAPATVTFTDNCDGAIIPTFNEQQSNWGESCQNMITRTWTAEDECGNIGYCVQVIYVNDTEKPQLFDVPIDIEEQCSEIPEPSVVTAYDNCDGWIEVEYSETPLNDVCPIILLRTWTATDKCGNSESASQLIIISDTENPELIGVPADDTVECDNVPDPAWVTAEDNCAFDLQVDYSADTTYNDCFYTIHRYWYVEDYCGNWDYAVQHITVVDTQEPYVVSSGPDELWVECDDDTPGPDLVWDDNCDAELEYTAISGTGNVTDCSYDIFQTYFAEDDCGNEGSWSRVIHISDYTDPYVVDAPNPYTELECGDAYPDGWVTFDDNCDEDLYTDYNWWFGDYTDCYYDIVEWWYAEDDCGNYIEYYRTVRFIDTTPPAIYCPETAFVGCTDEIPEPNVNDVYAYDECSGWDVTVEWIGDEVGDSTCVNRYIIERTYKATDPCGNVDYCIQLIGVYDGEGPELSELPDPIISCSYEGEPVQPLFTDACGGQYTVTYTDDPQQDTDDNDCTQTTIRNWLAIDDCGNETVIPQLLYITDLYDPIVVTELEDTTVQCIDEVPYNAPTFDDDCDLNLTIEVDTAIYEFSGCGWLYIITWTAMDECGNFVISDREVVVFDYTAPEVVSSGPEELWVNCDEDYPGPELVWEDNCDDTLAFDAISGINNVTECSYDVEQTFFAYDDCLNVTSWSRVIHVSDMSNPYIVSAPEEYTEIECGDDYPYDQVIFDDNCDEDLDTYYDWWYGDYTNCYFDVVEYWWAYDDCGNYAEFQRTVRIVDTVAPEIYCPDNYTVTCADEVGEPDASEAWAYDYCTGYVDAIWEGDEVTDSTCANRFVIERTYSATDDCGNTNYCTQYITVYDDEAPYFTYVPEATASCSEDIEFGTPEAEDNCGGVVTLTFEDEVVDVEENENECEYTVTRVWTATDVCGNSNTAEQVVTVSDDEDPTIVHDPADVVVECEDDLPPADEPVFDDNCDTDLEIFPASSITNLEPCGYTIHKSWKAVDNCGNEVTAYQNITVQDTQDPYVIYAPEEEIWVQCFEDVPAFEPTFGDNCDDELLVEAISGIGIDGCILIISRSATATDDCGNSISVGQVVFIHDTTDPTVDDNLQDMTIECGQPLPEVVPPAFDDNCDDELTIDYNPWTEELECGYAIHRVWTATDDCGNSVSAEQIITVTDTTPPIINPYLPYVEVECDEDWAWPIVTGYDLCSQVTITYEDDEVSGGCYSHFIRTFYVTDDCGNADTATVVIAVIDTTPPVIDNPVDEVVSCDNVPTMPEVGLYDNCDGPVTLVSATEEIEVIDDCTYQLIWHWVAEDYCGNQAEATTVITVMDWTAPELVNVPADAWYSCEEEWSIEYPTADDNCHQSWVVTEVDTIEGECINEFTVVYTFYAIDACGNQSEPVHVSIYVDDNTNPWFDALPSNESYQCIDWLEYEYQVLTASDNCGPATVSHYVFTNWMDNCGNGMWTVYYQALDQCNNPAYASYTITIDDTEAPLLDECPDDVQLTCGQPAPAPVVIAAWDECDGQLIATVSETTAGNVPDPGSLMDCNIKTPVRPATNPCAYPVDWAMGLFGLPKAYRYYTVHNGTFVKAANGVVTVTATFKNAYAPANGWNAVVKFNNEMAWLAWSTQTFPTNFKADCGGVGANHFDWMYYRLLDTPGAELIGFGAYAGSSLSVKHAPSNLYFGFQLGNGANNYNAVYGFGGWFTYSGTFKINGVPYGSSTGYITGAGDFAFELDCCPYYRINRTYTATDCSGNSVSCTQVIQQGTPPLLAPEAPSGFDTVEGEASFKVNPNPTSGNTWFTFTVKESANTTLELFDVAGKKVADLYVGVLETGEEYTVDYNAERLATGIYVYRLTNGTYIDQGKLIVNR
ncbi:MAG: T9SS type A sorting domain-containing protein, partial [Flavobacteriales bacterium]